MLTITFNGRKPQARQYDFSVVGNSKVDKINFVLTSDLDSEYTLEDLSELNAYVKVQSAGKEYIDKISATSSYDSETEQLSIELEMEAKTTAYRNIALQLQFEDDSGEIISQTEIVALTLSGNINADEEIPSKYPSVLTSLQEQIGEEAETRASADEDLQEQIDTKQDTLTFDDVPTEDSDNPVKSGGIYDTCEEIRAVAEGKTKSYTISYDDNADFNSQDSSISGVESITDISGNVIDVDDINQGDVILVVETDVPDRWFSSSDSKFYKLETAKIDLDDYYTKPQVDNKISDNNETIISDVYDETKTYSVGDLVIYNNVLYKCITAITTAEDFDSSKWTAIKIADLVSNETIVYLDTGTYTSGTAMSDNDLEFWTYFISLDYEAQLKLLKHTSIMFYNSTRKEWLLPYYYVRFTSAKSFYDIYIRSESSYVQFTLTKAKIKQGTY